MSITVRFCHLCAQSFTCFYFHLYSGKEQANILEGTVEDTQLMFIEKEIVAVTIENAFVQGSSAITSTLCEVYPNKGYNTDV
jgi:hypothetical protein